MLPSATRLALALALLATIPALLWAALARTPPLDAAGLALVLAAVWAIVGYLVALYLGMISWVREAFRAERRLHALRHLRFVCGLALAATVIALAAAYLRYEIVATGMRGGMHYYLVWDRWSGEVRVEAQGYGDRGEPRAWRAAY